MSTNTTSGNNLYRVGGIAAILGFLIMFGYVVLPQFLAIGLLVMAVYYFALYRVAASGLNLSAVLLAAGGSIAMLFTGVGPTFGYGIAMLVAFFLPALFAGLTANGQAGFPRALAIAGIVGGVFGILNGIVVTIGGGDYTNPNNPALTPFIYGTYLPGAIATTVWLVWGGIRMFRKA